MSPIFLLVLLVPLAMAYGVVAVVVLRALNWPVTVNAVSAFIAGGLVTGLPALIFLHAVPNRSEFLLLIALVVSLPASILAAKLLRVVIDESSPVWSWWNDRRLKFNGVLLLVIVCVVTLEQIIHSYCSSSDHGTASLIQMGLYVSYIWIANIFYNLGAIVEYFTPPQRVKRFRAVFHPAGTFVATLLPFGLGAVFAFGCAA